MAPPTEPVRRYNPYDICMEKALLTCQERGVQRQVFQTSAEKMQKLTTRCTDIARGALSWDIPNEKISSAVDDLCPPPEGRGGSGHYSVRISGTNDNPVPEGSSSFIKIDPLAQRILNLYGYPQKLGSGLKLPSLPIIKNLESLTTGLSVFLISPLKISLPNFVSTPVTGVRPVFVTAP